MDRNQERGAIALSVQNVLRSLRNVATSFKQEAESPDESDDKLRDLLPIFENEIVRFKMWAGNLAAHQSGSASLDHRLREAPHLQEQVVYLLRDISESLEDAIAVTSRGESLGGKGNIQDKPGSRPSSPELSSDDDSFTDSDMDDDGDVSPEARLSTVCTDIAEAIDCLLRLSVAIANPAPYERFRKLGAGPDEDVSFYEEHDVHYVQDKFPKINQDLSPVLGKFITRRRQFFKYREAHHNRLAAGLDVETHKDTSKTEIVPQTVASSLPEQLKASGVIDEDTRSEMALSETSYATSAGYLMQEDGQMKPAPPLKVPPPPPEAENGVFECPFCYRMISASTRVAWKRHVFGDLRPYTCLLSSCVELNTDFDRRHRWQLHVSQYHWRTWSCAFECGGTFPSLAELKDHIRQRHLPNASEEHLGTVVSRGEASVSEDFTKECPLCGHAVSGLKSYIKHVGRHLEQLALFALPDINSESLEDDVDSDAQNNTASDIEARSDDASSSTASSKAREQLEIVQETQPDIAQPLGTLEHVGTQITIPAELVDYFIGNDYTWKYEIERSSGALISIERAPNDDAGAYICAITGSRNATTLAASRINRIKTDEMLRRQQESYLNPHEREVRPWLKKKGSEADPLKKEIEEIEAMAKDAELRAKLELEAEREAALNTTKAKQAEKEANERLKRQIIEETRSKLDEASKKVKTAEPIKFKDAVGRKFSFPFHLCATWTGMEELIKQAFLQVEVLGPHVMEGHYDLLSPEGEIILPSVWEKVIQPGWAITMAMWPRLEMYPVKPPIPRRDVLEVPSPRVGSSRTPNTPTSAVSQVDIVRQKTGKLVEKSSDYNDWVTDHSEHDLPEAPPPMPAQSPSHPSSSPPVEEHERTLASSSSPPPPRRRTSERRDSAHEYTHPLILPRPVEPEPSQQQETDGMAQKEEQTEAPGSRQSSGVSRQQSAESPLSWLRERLRNSGGGSGSSSSREGSKIERQQARENGYEQRIRENLEASWTEEADIVIAKDIQKAIEEAERRKKNRMLAEQNRRLKERSKRQLRFRPEDKKRSQDVFGEFVVPDQDHPTTLDEHRSLRPSPGDAVLVTHLDNGRHSEISQMAGRHPLPDDEEFPFGDKDQGSSSSNQASEVQSNVDSTTKETTRSDLNTVSEVKRDVEKGQPRKGILKPPKDIFPEDPNPPREGVAPLKDKKLAEVPPGARWTKLDRRIVNEEALTIGHERFEVKDDCIIVLRVLGKEEIQAYATATQVLRERARDADIDADAPTPQNPVTVPDLRDNSRGPGLTSRGSGQELPPSINEQPSPSPQPQPQPSDSQDPTYKGK